MKKAAALLTDFGLTDCYVGIMKGVILGINLGVNLIDLGHSNPPQLRQGAFRLKTSLKYFPKKRSIGFRRNLDFK